jgi:hypothetical protein
MKRWRVIVTRPGSEGTTWDLSKREAQKLAIEAGLPCTRCSAKARGIKARIVSYDDRKDS